MAAHRPHSLPFSPQPTKPSARWSRLAVFSAVVVLSGCAALQIDVDVYKGPLINNEDIQRDQVLSMALSAKPLLLELRNKLLDAVKPNWHNSNAANRRSTLNPQQLDELTDAAVDDPKRNALRSARQLNNVITFYDNQGEPRMRSAANFIKKRQEIYERLLFRANSTLAARNNSYSDVKRTLIYRQAHEEQAVVWTELVALFHDVAKLPVSPTTSDTARVELLHELAERIAERTQPWLLACALENNIGLPNSLRGALANPGLKDGHALEFEPNTQWYKLRYERARIALAHALDRDPVAGAMALQQVDYQLRSALPLACFKPTVAGTKPPSEATSGWIGNTGLAREPRLEGRPKAAGVNDGSDNDDDSDAPKSLEELIARLFSLGASGFDHGRTHLGIDSLADRYATLRNTANEFAANEPKGKDARDSAQAEFRRVEHLLVDLATRMQFLATNLWLLEDGTTSGDNTYRADSAEAQSVASTRTALSTEDLGRYKTMMEAISNNLLVHADDLRNRAQYKERQISQGPADRAAAGAAFAVSSDAAFTAIEDGLTNAKNKASALESGASTLDKNITELTETIRLRSAEFTSRQKAAQELADLATGISNLALTMGLDKGAKSAKDVGLDGSKQRKADADRIHKLLSKSTDKADITVDKLREELAEWLKLEQADHKSVARLSHPRGPRLASAQAGLETFKVSDPLPSGPRAKQLANFKQSVVQARDAAKSASEKNPVLKADAELAKLETQLQKAQKDKLDKPPAVPVLDTVTALEQVRLLKPAVLTELAATPVAIDYNSTQRMLIKHLAQAAKAAAENSSAKAALGVTMKAVEQLPQLTRLKLDALPADSKSLDVLDAVIAELRYRAIEADRVSGPDSDSAKQATAALARAMKDRELQIFIRPSSTYLRSVYAANSLQKDPSLGQRNMLVDQFRAVLRNESVDRVRIDMDKTFWQNINTVRVSASGASNFVLAKDDVGNWYVKAMGADPTDMINAAKGMALYSMGGPINANLLQADELQQKIDAEKDPAKATALRKELKDHNTTNSSPAVGARSETLSLFVKNYDAQTAAHLKDLAANLAGDLYFVEIKKRWAESLKAPGDPKALDTLFADAEVSKHMAAARTAASVEKTGKDAAAALITSMQSLQRMRGTLKTLVRSHAPLTDKEAGAVAANTGLVNAAKTSLGVTERLVGESNDKLLEAIKKHEAAKLTGDNSKIAIEETNVDNARKFDTSSRTAFKEARTTLDDEQKKLTTADVVLSAAKKRQQDAIDDVDKVLKAAVTELADKRVRVVEETQTAVKVIGRSSP